MNSYYNLSEKQILSLIYQARSSKDPVVREAIDQLDYQLNKNKVDGSTYRLAAEKKLSKMDLKAYNNDELFVDDDAVVSSNSSGAYVQCWVWVENESKTRKRRRKVEND